MDINRKCFSSHLCKAPLLDFISSVLKRNVAKFQPLYLSNHASSLFFLARLTVFALFVYANNIPDLPRPRDSPISPSLQCNTPDPPELCLLILLLLMLQRFPSCGKEMWVGIPSKTSRLKLYSYILAKKNKEKHRDCLQRKMSRLTGYYNMPICVFKMKKS